jgi:hypothetical protein
MIKGSDKKGQFYLMLAVMIIGLIVGFFLVTNYSKQTSYSRVDNLGEQLKIESGKVLDNGAVGGNYNCDDFTQNFTNYAGKDIEIIYIIGNPLVFSVFEYNQSVKTPVNYTQNGDILSITNKEVNYNFKLKEGENFYFIIVQEIDGEKYVVTN